MSPRFRSGRPLSAETRRLALGILDAAEKAASSPGDVTERVHAVRTRLKRLVALLRLVRPALGEAAFATEKASITATADLLAGARDASVVEATLASLARRATPAAELALGKLGAALRARRGPAPDPLTDGAGRQLVARLEELRDRAGGWLPAAIDADTVDAGVDRVSRSARKRLARASEAPSASDLHALRRRVKDLAEQADLLRDVRGRRRRRLVGRLRRLGNVLGKEHDLAMLLAAMSAPAEALSSIERSLVVALVEERRARLRRRARRLAARMIDRRLARRIRGRASRALRDDAPHVISS